MERIEPTKRIQWEYIDRLLDELQIKVRKNGNNGDGNGISTGCKRYAQSFTRGLIKDMSAARYHAFNTALSKGNLMEAFDHARILYNETSLEGLDDVERQIVEIFGRDRIDDKQIRIHVDASVTDTPVERLIDGLYNSIEKVEDAYRISRTAIGNALSRLTFEGRLERAGYYDK